MTEENTVEEQPSWLNKGFFEDLLREENGRNVSVEIKNVQNAVPVGENYLSIIRRITLGVSEDGGQSVEKSLIVKDLPKGEGIQKFLKEDGVFKREICMYQKVLPTLYRIAEGRLEAPSLSAKCYPLDNDELLVMEDLRPSGFNLADRRQGLDYDHCLVAVKALARLHGMSVAAHEQDPDVFHIVKMNTLSQSERAGMKIRLESCFNMLKEVVKGIKGFERFVDKLNHIHDGLIDKIIRMMNPEEGELRVMNHGDFWVSNLLFRYDEQGKVSDIKIVDFQMPKYVTPAMDLHFFLVSSPNIDVRKNSVDRLLEEYHSELNDVLKRLNFADKQITLQRIKKELKDTGFYAVSTMATRLNMIVADPKDAPNIDEDTKSERENSMSKTYKGARYRELVQILLPRFEEQGIL
uniref:CHK kinase-like domain-containing protein n=1 Tax=Timema shepardi TaxID=629360 RepID=A0A7R9BAA9_TIMSH|nr:unnamed protein product [Timema shepardi]